MEREEMNTEIIEKKWQLYWSTNNTFVTDINDFSKPKFYALDMFPYPSGVGLHAGHTEGYTATDIVARMKKMQGFNVLHPMGFDSFGLPAEQYAIKTGNHPDGFTKKNIATFTEQLKRHGFAYDWNRCIETSDSSYYKWTQWIFKSLFNSNLAYKEDMPVNWCEQLGTVLANDEVINGKSERGGYPVVRKNMKQWVINIPKYAQVLLDNLDTLDWPESTKEIQRNWIGRSVGANVIFKVKDYPYDFTVFTTRCDTLFGATYCVLSPEHELVKKIMSSEKKNEVLKYISQCSLKSEIERTELNKEKTGIFIGAYAVNPVNNKDVPIWISDYVLSTYGTGAIMAVPAHDERDFEFAKKFNIDIIPVIDNSSEELPYCKDGLHINSEFLNGLNKEDAIEKMLKFLKDNNLGTKKINFKIRNWIFARQRYWGEPIPTVTLEDNTIVALDDEELPVILPELEDYSPLKSGESPLERADKWVNITYKGKKAKRETSTMPGAAGSSWYFLRYVDPFNDKCFADKKLLDHWLPVDLYIGGPEHSVGHLLYSRMWNNFLYDKGLVPTKEPFNKLRHQGMILGTNGIKMGKRYPEYCIDPMEMIKIYGADALRLYEMFMGPLESDKPWDNNGIKGSRNFLDRVWRLYKELDIISDLKCTNLDRVYNETIKKVTNDYETLNFNTAISQMMIFVNTVYKENVFPLYMAKDFLKLLNPVCPHITEELWSFLGHTKTIAFESWPTYDESILISNSVNVAISVNGKVRGVLSVNVNISNEELLCMAKKEKNVMKFIEGKEIIKEIVVPNKIVNIVIK